jgi:hypothetical protein
MKLCWFCRKPLNIFGDDALLWDVRLCCKKCFIEKLEELNTKLNKLAQNGLKSVSEASGDTK